MTGRRVKHVQNNLRVVDRDTMNSLTADAAKT